MLLDDGFNFEIIIWVPGQGTGFRFAGTLIWTRQLGVDIDRAGVIDGLSGGSRRVDRWVYLYRLFGGRCWEFAHDNNKLTQNFLGKRSGKIVTDVRRGPHCVKLVKVQSDMKKSAS